MNATPGNLQLATIDTDHEVYWKKFAMVVAHDLKEPLRNISSCALMLASLEPENQEERQEICGWLKASAHRLDGLVQGLYDHARLGGENVTKDLDLGRLASEIQDDFRCLIQRTGAQVNIGNLPVIQAGALGMRIVLSNLIENAIKYGRPGVQVQVQVHAKRTSEGWLLVVEDNGRGMSPEEMSTVFQPFKRFAHAEEGLGMGLCHVHSIVENHQGRIQLHSQPGVGSRFEVLMPG